MSKNSACLILTLLVSFLLVHVPAPAQTDSEGRPAHLEVPNDPYVPISRESMDVSPAYEFSAAGIVTTQVNVNGNGQNIVGDAANEPSIAINPNDANFITIGWRQFDTIASDFRQAGYGYSDDAGATWTFPGVINPGVFRSDPVLDFDASGNVYYNSLTADGFDFSTNVYISTTGGSSWDSGTYAHGGDKQWMAIDRSGGVGDGHIYSFWTQSFSICYPDFFTRSVNGGGSYQSCISVAGDPYWGTLAVGPDGELYVSGSGFVVAKSTTAREPGQNVTWDFSQPVSLDGSLGFSTGPNPAGLLGQTWVAVDNGDGPNRGNVYLLASVNRFSNPDPLDVMFARSENGGQTWSAPVRVNDDPGNNAYQWFGTMSVAPNGRIDVVWLDTRDNPGSFNSALYYSYSEDAGVTWSTNEVMSESFDPHVGWPQQNKMGDYFDMVSEDGGAHLAWAGTFNGEQDVYYSYITPDAVQGIPCADIDRFQARCLTGGQVQARAIFTDDSHTGEFITISIDGVPYETRVRANQRASISLTGFDLGDHTVELTDPSGCFDPIVVTCTAAISLDGDDGWSDKLTAERTTSNMLFENYPDPFNPTTTIRYTLAEESHVSVKIYNMIGQAVATLVDRAEGPGYHEVVWDGRNDFGSSVSSGIYIYRLTAGDFSEAKRMLLTK